MSTVYLVSGANRGIGLGLVTKLAARPNTVVFAGARNVDSATNIKELVEAHPNVHIVKLTSGDEGDNNAAVETIRKVAGRLDVVIANAGIANTFETVLDVPMAHMRQHWEVNVGGPLILFQKTFPLLLSSPRTPENPPKFIVITSMGGSIENVGHLMGMAAYRNSKAAVNQLTREIHFEHEKDGLVAFPMCPGAVETEMLQGAKKNNEAFAKFQGNTVETSVNGLLTVIDKATRETHGGKFTNWAEESLPW